MARRGKDPERRPANLSAVQMQAALPRLERRLADLEAAKTDPWSEEKRRELDALHTEVDATLSEIFGEETTDYAKFAVFEFWRDLSYSLGREHSPSEYSQAYRAGIETAKTTLRSIVKLFNERLTDMGASPVSRAASAASGMNLHPAIEKAAGSRLKSGHYADAIEAACKALNAVVQTNSGEYGADGAPLMRQVFSSRNPILAVVPFPYRDKSDESEQEGVMHLFEGVQLALRNPRAHKLKEDDPGRAIEFVSLVSLLAKIADDATKV